VEGDRTTQLDAACDRQPAALSARRRGDVLAGSRYLDALASIGGIARIAGERNK